MARQSEKKTGKVDSARLDKAFAHLCNLVATEGMLRLLRTRQLDAVAGAVICLLNQQDDYGDDDTPVVTPIDTFQHGLPHLSDVNRDALGMMMVAMLETQADLQRRNGQRTVTTKIRKMLDDADKQRKAPAKKRRR